MAKGTCSQTACRKHPEHHSRGKPFKAEVDCFDPWVLVDDEGVVKRTVCHSSSECDGCSICETCVTLTRTEIAKIPSSYWPERLRG